MVLLLYFIFQIGLIYVAYIHICEQKKIFWKNYLLFLYSICCIYSTLFHLHDVCWMTKEQILYQKCVAWKLQNWYQILCMLSLVLTVAIQNTETWHSKVAFLNFYSNLFIGDTIIVLHLKFLLTSFCTFSEEDPSEYVFHNRMTREDMERERKKVRIHLFGFCNRCLLMSLITCKQVDLGTCWDLLVYFLWSNFTHDFNSFTTSSVIVIWTQTTSSVLGMKKREHLFISNRCSSENF